MATTIGRGVSRQRSGLTGRRMMASPVDLDILQKYKRPPVEMDMTGQPANLPAGALPNMMRPAVEPSVSPGGPGPAPGGFEGETEAGTGEESMTEMGQAFADAATANPVGTMLGLATVNPLATAMMKAPELAVPVAKNLAKPYIVKRALPWVLQKVSPLFAKDDPAQEPVETAWTDLDPTSIMANEAPEKGLAWTDIDPTSMMGNPVQGLPGTPSSAMEGGPPSGEVEGGTGAVAGEVEGGTGNVSGGIGGSPGTGNASGPGPAGSGIGPGGSPGDPGDGDSGDGGTWLCTEYNRVVGLEREQWKVLPQFRAYIDAHHQAAFNYYLLNGQELIEAMARVEGDNLKDVYERWGADTLIPVIDQTVAGETEEAYQMYAASVIDLMESYAPHLVEGAHAAMEGDQQ